MQKQTKSFMFLSALFLTIQHFPALLQTSLIGHTAHLGFLAVHTARPCATN